MAGRSTTRRPAVLRCLHAIDATRLQERRSWVVSFVILGRFGPRRGRAACQRVRGRVDGVFETVPPRRRLRETAPPRRRRCGGLVTLSRHRHYGDRSFLWQCKHRFGDELGPVVWEGVNACFDRLPLCAVIDDEICCVHGGMPRRPPPKYHGRAPSTADTAPQIPRKILSKKYW